ncbi:LysR substrate-binding domain-containing protein [Solimonas marina]|uniref:LysR family transcriptional regulator n=1 Tax=Solimonas marina TaxID=2714601 RepID=A0A969W9Z3_9GAMM|nr:LysR substrate-binding domain-containing protein [Solimonas marina]NKF22279.1 LysR family transcriptional regulator [Solimonas marina]
MPTRLPPLATLQAFEAAVRHQSYTRAAQELALTHGAISHHVSALEERLGLRLFERDGNRMVPTEHGRLLVVKVRQALGLLERGFARAGRDEHVSLAVSVLPALASRWLAPRLPNFAEQHPDIDLCLDVRSGVADLAAGDADAAIRYGPGGWPDVQQVRLMGDELLPVCAPHYRGGRLPASVAELGDCTLLRNPWVPWEPWLHAAGAEWREPKRGPVCTDSAVLLDMAATGLGVALARRVFDDGDLRSGRLVRVLDISVPDPSSYFFVWRADHPQIDAIHLLRDWLLEQVLPTT